jgi:hypothetical protein
MVFGHHTVVVGWPYPSTWGVREEQMHAHPSFRLYYPLAARLFGWGQNWEHCYYVESCDSFELAKF